MQRDLSVLLSNAPKAGNLEDQVEWLESLLDWVRLPIDVSKESLKGPIQLARLKFLISFLDRHEGERHAVSACLKSILSQSRAVELFCETGMNREYGFVGEMIDRILNRISLSYSDPSDLAGLFTKVFKSEDDANWIESIDPLLWNKVHELFLPTDRDSTVFREQINDAISESLAILTARLCSIVSAPEMRKRMRVENIAESPFYRLALVVSTTQTSEIAELLQQANDLFAEVYTQLEDSGVSVELVFNIERGKAIILRLRHLLQLQMSEASVSSELARVFIADMIRDHFLTQDVLSLIGQNLNLISKKIVERAGVTGEHYIVRNKKEYREMFFSGGGGGAFTVLTILLKTAISKAGLPLFFEGLFSWINYTGSFAIMQLAHFTLATKTPAATAAALAGRLRNLSEHDVEEFLNEVKALTRSAFAAVLGNVGLVIPGAFVFDFLYTMVTKQHFFNEAYSLYQLHNHHPLQTLTILYAIETGCLLWFGSILGGWIENAFVFRRVAETISKGRRFRFFLRDEGAVKLAHWLKGNIAGMGTNVALGFLLGFASIFGKFFGAPFDVRHITLSSGTVAFSYAGLANPGEHTSAIIGACIGLFFIAFLNFSVSFALSLFVAARARQIRLGQFSQLVARVFKELLRRPFTFLFIKS